MIRTSATTRAVLMLTVAGVWLCCAGQAEAVIEQLMDLATFIKDSDEIRLVRVTQFDSARPTAVLDTTDELKGKDQPQRMPVNLKGRKPAETEQLLARLTDGVPLVLFVYHHEKVDLAYAFSNGTWFQLMGHRDGKLTRWAFTDLEPYLPRTFNGSTDELRETVAAALAGQRKPPPANPKLKPGIGPPIEKPAKTESDPPPSKAPK